MIDIEVLEKQCGRRNDHTSENKSIRSLFAVEPAPVEPRSVAWRNARPAKYHLDQKRTSGCTGWALVNTLNHKPYHKLHRPTLGDEAGRVRYVRATELDIWPGVYNPATGEGDEGSSGGAAAEGARQDGIITGNQWIFNEAQFWAALAKGPIYTGTVWKERMFYPDDRNVIHAAGSDRGGHQYVIDAYSKRSDLFRIPNTWGRDWAENGSALIPRKDYFDLLFNQGGDAQLLIL